MEVVYCSRCGGIIPPGGIDEGRHYLIEDEPVCLRCYRKLPEEEKLSATETRVPTLERLTSDSGVMAAVAGRRPPSSKLTPAARRPPSSKLTPAARRPSSRRLPAESSRWSPTALYAAIGGVVILILTGLLFTVVPGGPRSPGPEAGGAGSGKGPGSGGERKGPAQNPPGPKDDKLPGKATVGNLTVEILSFKGSLREKARGPGIAPAGSPRCFCAGAGVSTTGGETWGSLPQWLAGRTRIFGPRQGPEAENRLSTYLVGVSAPCLLYVTVHSRSGGKRLDWMDDSWELTKLECRSWAGGTLSKYMVWKKEVSGPGKLVLGSDNRSGESVNYVFVPLAGGPAPPGAGKPPFLESKGLVVMEAESCHRLMPGRGS